MECDAQLQENYSREDSAELKAQRTRNDEYQNSLVENDWISVSRKKVNRTPNFNCNHGFKTNQYIRNLDYQKENYENEQYLETLGSRTPGFTQTGVPEYFCKTNYMDKYKGMWYCRF